MKPIKITTKVYTTEQLVRFLEVIEDIEDRFDFEFEVVIDPGKELLERW